MMGTTRCPNCGEPLGAGSSFCPSCGASLAAPSYSTGVAYAAQPAFQRIIPLFSGNGYTIEQKILALRDTFGIKDPNGNQLAYVKKQFVSFGPKFWFESTNGQKLGEIHGKVMTIRPAFEIYDAQGRMIAQVKKKLMKLIGQEWWMENSSGQEIAKVKGNVLAHDYYIQDMSGQPIAQIHKKWVSVRDAYNVEILNPSFDPYLAIAYAISMDHTQKEKHER